MSGFGGFSPEAYDQLRQSYAQQLLKAEEAEAAGVTIGQDRLGLETAPLKSPWLDKTGLWQYPDGRGEHMDVQKKQLDLLAALQRDEEDDVDLASLSDEEIDSMIEEVLAEIDEDEVEEGEEEMSDEEIESLVNEVLSNSDDEDLNLEDMSDEELDQMIDEILAGVERDEEAQAAGFEDEEEDGEEESVRDAATIAQQIAELKAELAAMAGDEVGEASESEDDYETSDEEETESEDDTDEEEPSDDESD